MQPLVTYRDALLQETQKYVNLRFVFPCILYMIPIIIKKPTRCNKVALLVFFWLDMFGAISPIIRSVDLYYSMWCSTPSFVVLLCGYPGRLLCGLCVHTQQIHDGYCVVRVSIHRKSMKVAAWSVCPYTANPWWLLRGPCLHTQKIHEGYRVVRVSIHKSMMVTAWSVSPYTTNPLRLLRGPCVHTQQSHEDCCVVRVYGHADHAATFNTIELGAEHHTL
jgi:hypothetical protein